MEKILTISILQIVFLKSKFPLQKDDFDYETTLSGFTKALMLMNSNKLINFTIMAACLSLDLSVFSNLFNLILWLSQYSFMVSKTHRSMFS